MRNRWLAVLSSLCIALLAQAAPAAPVVVELFTSQGCSSCPPAEKLLGEVARKPNVIALAYHVDYWDERGWRDPFSLSEATQRQAGYVRRLSRAGPFTPQAVVSGDTSFIGSNRAEMTAALAGDRDALAIELSQAGGTLSIAFTEGWRESMDVYVVSYRARATTHIGGGENARRSLEEHNIVRSFKRLATWNGKPQTMTVSLASFPKDATHAVVMLQRRNQGAIAGAAALALPVARSP